MGFVINGNKVFTYYTGFTIAGDNSENCEAYLNSGGADYFSVFYFQRNGSTHGYVGSGGATDRSISLNNLTTGDRLQIHDTDGIRIYGNNTKFGKSGDHTITTYDTNANLIINPNGTGEVNVQTHLNINNTDNTNVNIKGNTTANLILRSTDNSIRGILRHTVSTFNGLQLINYVNYPSIQPRIEIYDEGSINVISDNSNPITLNTDLTNLIVVGKSTASTGILRLEDYETDYASGRGAIIDCIGFYDTGLTCNFGRIFTVKENSTQGDQKGRFYIQTNDSGTLRNGLEIDSSQNVNIPNGDLEINGTTTINSNREASLTNLDVDYININGSIISASNLVSNLTFKTDYSGGYFLFANDATGRKAGLLVIPASDSECWLYAVDKSSISTRLDLRIGYGSGTGLFYDYSTDSIGLSTDTPAQTLDVNGNIGINGTEVITNSRLIKGGIQYGYSGLITASNYNIAANDSYILTSSASNSVDIDLPEASSYIGKRIVVCASNSSNSTTITCDGTSDQIYDISGTAYSTCTISSASSWVELMAMYNNQWQVIAKSSSGVAFS